MKITDVKTILLTGGTFVLPTASATDRTAVSIFSVFVWPEPSPDHLDHFTPCPA